MWATIFTSRTAQISEKSVVMFLKLCLLKKRVITFFKKFTRHVMLESATLIQTVAYHRQCYFLTSDENVKSFKLCRRVPTLTVRFLCSGFFRRLKKLDFHYKKRSSKHFWGPLKLFQNVKWTVKILPIIQSREISFYKTVEKKMKIKLTQNLNILEFGYEKSKLEQSCLYTLKL